MTVRNICMPSLMSRNPLHPPLLPPPPVLLDDLSGLTATTYNIIVQREYLKYLGKNVDDHWNNRNELENRYDEIANTPVYYYFCLGLIIGLVGLVRGVLFNSDSIFTALGIVYIAFFFAMVKLCYTSFWKLDNLKLKTDFIENRRVALREFLISFIGQLNGTDEYARIQAASSLGLVEFSCTDFRKKTLIFIAVTSFSSFLSFMAITLLVLDG